VSRETRVEPFGLVAGLACVLAAGLFLLDDLSSAVSLEGDVVAPAVLVALGAVGAVLGVLRLLRPRRADRPAPESYEP
jgi:hypothetical protein